MRPLAIFFSLVFFAAAQDIKLDILGGQAMPAIAIPDLNGTGAAQSYMAVFNATVAADVEESGAANLKPKSLYPNTHPAQPRDVRPNDWTAPPVSAGYLALGYGAIQADQFVFRGYLVDFSPNPPLLGAIYRGAVSEAGARKAAHEFAADIIRKLGGQPVIGSKIFFRSNRSGRREIWVMDFDGGNQRQLTKIGGLVSLGVSPEGDAFVSTAFTPFPKLTVWSFDPARPLRFANPEADLVTTASFTPDGRQILYAFRRRNRSSIVIANRDGSSPRTIEESAGADVEPVLNPKSSTLAFVSDRSGPPQVYTMNLDGGDINRITSGEGEAVNPAWHPKGEILAFAWTRGPIPGKFKIFVMGVAQRDPLLLTRDESRNEHPSWAPDGVHIVFASDRSGRSQIWTMLADGTHLRQLTSEGVNDTPVWSR